MKIKYLSHGLHETGGYEHEKVFSAALGETREIRFRKNYKGFFAWIVLFFKSFFAAKGEVVVTVARLAWPVFFRTIFGKTKVILVLHNYDRSDGKPKLYYGLLNIFLKLASLMKKKLAVVVVANYWKVYFEARFSFGSNIFVFPNLFNNAGYSKFITDKKGREIHLGQISDKIDGNAYRELIPELRKHHFEAYFSTNIQGYSGDFPVIYFSSKESYLEKMAISKATVILNKIEEGWNRVAHESFLVGTSVIGSGSGGLAEMLRKFGGMEEKNTEAIVQLLLQDNIGKINRLKLAFFDVSMAETYAKPIKEWMEA